MSEANVQVLNADFVPECARVMALGFCDSPSYNYIFRGTKEYRVQALEWTFARNILMVLDKCQSALRGMLNSNGEVICCFLWIPAALADSSLWEMIKAGVWLMPFKFGVSTVSRLLNIIDQMERNSDGNSQTAHGSRRDALKLERMVVRPDYQGQGVGSRALRSVLDEASQMEKSVEIHLETQEERNVEFYTRLGFQVTNTKDFYEDEPEYTFRSWHMVQKTS
uniref:N-acetyltransferase domain-containing protein n=1 Tax=Timspurckia oligopyrenoides TaxID=708627 RepID=A0A7S0ZJ82_9RHOD|mmetsp:Transcript_7448/g.13465  ORF Transcript_7448/g.13465 Transcript_7448/m.13465 type:complete len:223 (+) Transcript_7448:255-923(+)